MQCDPLHLSIDLIPPDEGMSACKILCLTNNNPHRVAFKIRTTNREKYTTSPNGGLIEPGAEVDVLVQISPLTQAQFAEYSEPMAYCPDKLLVRSTQAEDATQGTTVHGEGSNEWWQSRPASAIFDQVITCSFVKRSERMEVAQKQLRFMPEGRPARTVGSNKVLAEEIMHVVNNTASRQAFKIRTTARDRYRVEPSCGIVDKGLPCAVCVSMVLPHAGTADKFQVRCVAVDPDTDEVAVRKNEWWGTAGVRSRVYDTTLDSILLQPVMPATRQDLLDVPVQASHGTSKAGPAPMEAPLSLAPKPGDFGSANDGSYDHLFKIVLIGDSNVGKTSLLTRFSDNTFTDSFIATIGVDFRVRTIQLNGKTTKLQIWDTAGQERFRTITSAYYRGADGIIIVYDVTNKDSFENVQMWLGEIDKHAQDTSSVKLIVGNKCDLPRPPQAAAEAEQFCQSRGFTWIETSAKASTRVENAFFRMVGDILKVKESEDKKDRGGEGPTMSDAADPVACLLGCFSWVKSSIKNLMEPEHKPPSGYAKY
mmetsp:Transcript_60760/g.149433  ORF Transcript_60760/g.149433 Transcript_60760/m.149433 type:complete len:537 (+) Transcript_60760:169-1779(+)